MSETSKLDRALSIVFTVAAVLAVAVLIEARLNPRQSKDRQKRVELVKNWQKQTQAAGIPLRDTLGTVKIAVFTDFQCPYCKNMDSLLSQFDLRFPGRLGRSVLHFPIPSHSSAMAAAKAFQCGTDQGRSAEMHHALYANQEVLGKRSWQSIAAEAGVLDTLEFEQCLGREGTGQKIALGIALADKLSVSTTPTVLVNGWLIHPSSPEAIEAAVVAAVAGRPPSR